MSPISSLKRPVSPIVTPPVPPPLNKKLPLGAPSNQQFPNFQIKPAPAPTSLSSTVAALGTARKSVDLVKASPQAPTQDSALVASLSKALNLGKEVKGLFELGVKLSNSGAQGKDIVDSVGQYAQQIIQGKMKTEALTKVLSEAGIKANLIPHITTENLLQSGYEYLNSGFDSSAFFKTLESKASESLAKAGKGAAVSPAAGETTSVAGLGSKVIGAVGAAYSAYQVFAGWGKGRSLQTGLAGAVNGATAGAYLGSSILPGLGTVIGGTLGGAIGLIGGLVTAGKHKDQLARDGIRDILQQAGIINKDWQLTLADGSLYDIGKDGGFKLQNLDGTSRHAYDVDLSNPLAVQVSGMANSLAALVTGGDPKLTSDYAGYFTNAALSNATTLEDAKRNLQAIFSSFGTQPEQALQGLTTMAQRGLIPANQAESVLNGFIALFGEEKTSEKSAVEAAL